MKATFLFIALFWFNIISAQQHKVKVTLHSIESYGPYEDLAKRACAVFEKVLNSEAFSQAVLSGRYEKTNGYNNQKLYDIIMKAQEKKGPGGKDSVVDLRVRILDLNGRDSYWKDNCELGSKAGTIGVDGGKNGITATCPQRLELWAKEDNVPELAGHYAHEYMHTLGFNHYIPTALRLVRRQRWRQKTFVYKIGYLVRDLAKKEIATK